MQPILRYPIGLPDWQAASVRRLNISLLLATLVVMAVLSLIRLPAGNILLPLSELLVTIVGDEMPAETPELTPQLQEAPREGQAETKTESPADTAPADRAAPAMESPAPMPATDAIDEPPIAWEQEKLAAVTEAIDAAENPASVNPGFDERRREAAIRFRPSDAPVKREIWDNVEKDQLGRTILKDGNCFRVLDDPSVVNRWAFENFDQYIRYCTFTKYEGKDLPWVEEVKDRHAYLREQEERRNDVFADDAPER